MTSPRVHLGTYPTPVLPLESLSGAMSALWIKRDDLTSTVYGGNKVRKLEHVLFDARERGKTRLVTLGAAGSHHVLATATFGRRAGFDVTAVLVPQPTSAHAMANLRAGLGQGLHARAAGGYPMVPLRLLPRLGKDAYFVQVGGSSVQGTLGYVDAAHELALQVKTGQMPEPDVVVVTVGSGGTAAGIAAGLEMTGMRARVVGVIVAEPPRLIAWYARWLAKKCLRDAGHPNARAVRARMTFDARWLGKGYGHPTDAGAWATAIAKEAGIQLDPTYTAKTFAAALDLVGRGKHRTILYWHTLSSAPMAPLLEGAPAEEAVATDLRGLLR